MINFASFSGTLNQTRSRHSEADEADEADDADEEEWKKKNEKKIKAKSAKSAKSAASAAIYGDWLLIEHQLLQNKPLLTDLQKVEVF